MNGRDVPRGTVIVVVALTASAALGSNVTVVLAASPSLLALAYLIVRLGGTGPRQSAFLLASVAGAVVAFSIPFAPWFMESLALQAPAVPGLRIGDDSIFSGLYLQGVALGLPTPFAAIGLEPPYAPSAILSSIAFVGWGLLLAGLFLWTLVRMRSNRPPMAALMGLFVVSALNAAIVAVASGIGGYGLYKWFGVMIPLAVPLTLALWLSTSRAAAGEQGWLAVVGSVVVLVSTTMAYSAGLEIGERGYVASRSLLALGADSDLSTRDVVNIDTGNWMDDAMVAVVLPSRTVIVTRRTYAPGSAAVGPDFLASAAGIQTGAGERAFVLTRRGAPTVPAELDFSANQENDPLVLGDAYRPVGSRYIATARSSTITLRPTIELGGGGCALLIGMPFLEPDKPLEMTVTVGDQDRVQRQFTSETPTWLALSIPPRTDGDRLVIEIETSATYTRGSLGYPELAKSGFGLQRLLVEAAPCPQGAGTL